MRKENTMDSTEAPPLCGCCRRVPVSHLALDVSEPLVGWEAFFEERYITVMDDSLGRPSVSRHVLGDLIAEQREREARLAERPQPEREPVAAGLPAQEGMSAAESMMASPGYMSARDEFERFPRPSFLDEEFARAREHQRAEQEVARRKEKAE